VNNEFQRKMPEVVITA